MCAGELCRSFGLTFEVLDELQPIILAAQKCSQAAFAFNEREIAQVGAIKLKNVKRQMHRPIVLPSSDCGGPRSR